MLMFIYRFKYYRMIKNIEYPFFFYNYIKHATIWCESVNSRSCKYKSQVLRLKQMNWKWRVEECKNGMQCIINILQMLCQTQLKLANTNSVQTGFPNLCVLWEEGVLSSVIGHLLSSCSGSNPTYCSQEEICE